MSQAQLAGDELTKGFISQVESGLVRPSVRSLQIIATRLAKSLDYFLGDAPLAAEKRLAFHRLAAEAAAERHDWDVVRAEVASGLECAPGKRDRAAFLRLLAQAELAVSAREPAFDRINEALSLIDATVDAPEVARLQHLRGIAYAQLSQYLASAEALEQARDTMERHEVNDPRLRARILVALGTVYRRLNRTAKAMQTYSSALDLASASSELRVAAQGYMGVAVSLYDAGDSTPRNSYRRALELFERVEDAPSSCRSSTRSRRSTSSAARSLKPASSRNVPLALAKMSGDTRVEAAAQVILARILLSDGEAEQALESREDRRESTHAGFACSTPTRFASWVPHTTRSGRMPRATRHTAGPSSCSPRSTTGRTGSAIAAEYSKKLRARGDVDAAFHYLELARGR